MDDLQVRAISDLGWLIISFKLPVSLLHSRLLTTFPDTTMLSLDGLFSQPSDVLLKVAMFVLVQALVYLILSKSSNIFSTTKTRSLSFRTVRSVSIRRMLAALSDLPPGGEPSPSSSASPASNPSSPASNPSSVHKD